MGSGSLKMDPRSIQYHWFLPGIGIGLIPLCCEKTIAPLLLGTVGLHLSWEHSILVVSSVASGFSSQGLDDHHFEHETCLGL